MNESVATFNVRLEQFTGPLDLLLSLIEGRRLDISTVSLSKVTDDYLHYLQEHPISPEELSDFLVIATKLLFIKSQNLLPTTQVADEEGADLEQKLKEFQRVKMMAKRLKEALRRRTPFLERNSNFLDLKIFLPPKNFDLTLLHENFKKIFQTIQFIDIKKLELKKILKLEKAINRFKALIERNASLTFDAVSGKTGHGELIVYFLALLHLVRMGKVIVTQPKIFGTIHIKRNRPE